MSHNIIFFCKTYNKDITTFTRMVKSFQKFNADNISLFVSVPREDLKLFKHFKTTNIALIEDESYASKYLTTKTHWGLSPGYINQEICKLSFWEICKVDNYLCIDSDVQFIKNFHVSDFMRDKKIPYTVLVMDKDLSIEYHYKKFWHSRQNHIKKIYQTVGLNDARLRTCHGMQVLNKSVLKSMKNDFMAPHNFTYESLIEIAPYEFTWYNVWLQKSKIIDEVAVEPFFKTFHYRIEYTLFRLKLITLEDMATAYLGIVLNSNWRPIKPPKIYKNPGILCRLCYHALDFPGLYINLILSKLKICLKGSD